MRNFYIDKPDVILAGLTLQGSGGIDYRHVAKDIHLSTATVSTHIKHIFDKQQVNNKTDALLRARRENLM